MESCLICSKDNYFLDHTCNNLYFYRMQKKFLTNLALILFLNLLIKPIYILGIETQVQNQTQAASFGIYFAIYNFCFILTIILDFGITNFNNKYIAQNNHLLTKHFSALFTRRPDPRKRPLDGGALAGSQDR